ncbi:response regulator transcription factor [Caballeronia sp. EK]|uniref:response regulator transcription factor n=1 Tax=Caballeronia sp. EK TaxID=2767469 RepID=UPI0016563F67|nr:response regulator transcription factor [Caballeronia sp. EK]MBC8642961.1 response regulator transcription factor [Caballeronia sp. EK]
MRSLIPLVAVVEDNPCLLADLVEFLRMRGFSALGFVSAEDFFVVWPAQRFDLLLLDVALPGVGGLEVTKRVRAQDTAGIVMLTAFDSNDYHAQGLSAGADVFLSKRSSLEVIEAACHSLLLRLERHHSNGAQDAAIFASNGAWCLRARHWRLTAPDGTAVELTHAEVGLLAALFECPGQVIERNTLLKCLGKPPTLSNLRNLDNTASRLRRKVQEACGVDLPIRPSYGKGYTFLGLCEVAA